MIDLKMIADEAEVIISGFAFTPCEEGIRIFNVNYSATSNRASEQEARHCLPSTGLMYDYRPYSLSIRA